MQNKQPLFLALFLAGSLCCANALAEDKKAEAKAQLNNVTDTVKAQQAALKTAKMSRKELLALQESAAETEVSQALLDLQADVAIQVKKLAALTHEQAQESEKQKDHINLLVMQLRAIQRQAEPSYLQAILSQDDPSQVARGLTYYRYFHQARATQMAEITEKLAAITEKKQALSNEQVYYQTLIDSQQEKQQTLAEHSAERKIVVAALDT